jgi:hypothetical protein
LRLRLSLLGGILAVIFALTAPLASALTGPSTLATGFGSDTLAPEAGQANTWFGRMEQLGSSWVRIAVAWNVIAPSTRPAGFNPSDPGDPNYNWFVLDILVRDAAAYRQHAVLMVGSAPSWAEARGAPSWALPNTWRPSPVEYAAFARALAKRYSGRFPDPRQPGQTLPRVSYFQAWNEPNLPTTLAPQWRRTRHGYAPASPAIYRGLLNAFYAAVKAVQPQAYVLAGGLAPYGDRPGLARMHPVTFLRALLDRHASFDAIDIHPYGLTPTHHASNPDDVSVPDLGRVRHVLRDRSEGSKPIWVTELDWDSKPDPAGVSLPQQARYLARALYELWRQGVSHVLWYQPHDLGGTPRGGIPDGGLFTGGGQAKPASVAFYFPFVAIGGSTLTTLWGRAPRAGVVTVEVAGRGRWHTLLRLRTTRGGVFLAQRAVAGHLTLRAVLGPVASFPCRTG